MDMVGFAFGSTHPTGKERWTPGAFSVAGTGGSADLDKSSSMDIFDNQYQ